MTPIILAENILANGTLTAGTTAAGYDVNNITDSRPYTLWIANDAADVAITLNLSIADIMDTLAIFNSNLADIGATVEVWYTPAGGASTRFAYFKPTTNTILQPLNVLLSDTGLFVPTEDYKLIITSDPPSSTQFIIKITGCSAPPQIANMLLGIRLEIPVAPEAPYIPLSETIVANSADSERGRLLGSDIRYFPSSIAAKCRFIDRVWYETYFVPFKDNYYKQLIPFFYAWDLIVRPQDVFFVRADDAQKIEEPLSLLAYVDEINLILKELI